MVSPMTRLARRVSSFRIQPSQQSDIENITEQPEQKVEDNTSPVSEKVHKGEAKEKEEEVEWTKEQYCSDYFPELLDDIDLGKVKEFAVTFRKKQLPSTSQSITCKIIGQDEGNNNLVFFIKFSDGVQWVARIPSFGREPTPDQAKKMASEYTSMQYISQKTTLPLRLVHYWTSDPSEVGVAFALLSYIEGQALYYSLQTDETFDREKRLAVLSSVAEHMKKLYILQFPSTGALNGTSDELGQILRHVPSGNHYNRKVATIGRYNSFQEILQDVAKDLRGKQSSSWSKNYLNKAILKMATRVPSHMLNPPLTLSLGTVDVGSILVDAKTGKVTGFLGSDRISVQPAHLGSAAYPDFLLRNLNADEFSLIPGCTFAESCEMGDVYRKHYVKCWQGFNVRSLGMRYDIRWTKESHVMNKVWRAVKARDHKNENYVHQCVNEAYAAMNLKGVSRSWINHEDGFAYTRTSIRGLIKKNREKPGM